MNVAENEISVPWGHIAAKIWGNRNNPLVLVFHGIMDNAGSFDRLIPLLPNSFCYVCTDLPGHGKSSHFHPFFPLYTINNVIVYKLIMQHFKREKYIILGHSYGALMGLLFAQLYPEFVEKLIMLETVHLPPVSTDEFQKYLREKFDNIIALGEKTKTREIPMYTYAGALQKLQGQRAQGCISSEAAAALLQRAIVPIQDGKFVFTLDQRMKDLIHPIHDIRYMLETLKKFPITCPVLMVLRKSGVHWIRMKFLQFFQKQRNFSIKHVDGTHDVHINNPEIVAPLVTTFLLKQTGKL